VNKTNISKKAVSLIDYCLEKNRACPLPDAWVKLWRLLPNKVQIGAGYKPSSPLILSGWWYSTNQDKSERLQEHIRWADANGAIEQVDKLLRSLDESEWHHFSE
jgi:hypothetical protein